MPHIHTYFCLHTIMFIKCSHLLSMQTSMSVRVVETTATPMPTVPTLMAASSVPVSLAIVALEWTVKVRMYIRMYMYVCKCIPPAQDCALQGAMHVVIIISLSHASTF